MTGHRIDQFRFATN